jgi:hypothetical protein
VLVVTRPPGRVVAPEVEAPVDRLLEAAAGRSNCGGHGQVAPAIAQLGGSPVTPPNSSRSMSYRR